MSVPYCFAMVCNWEYAWLSLGWGPYLVNEEWGWLLAYIQINPKSCVRGTASAYISFFSPIVYVREVLCAWWGWEVQCGSGGFPEVFVLALLLYILLLNCNNRTDNCQSSGLTRSIIKPWKCAMQHDNKYFNSVIRHCTHQSITPRPWLQIHNCHK